MEVLWALGSRSCPPSPGEGEADILMGIITDHGEDACCMVLSRLPADGLTGDRILELPQGLDPVGMVYVCDEDAWKGVGEEMAAAMAAVSGKSQNVVAFESPEGEIVAYSSSDSKNARGTANFFKLELPVSSEAVDLVCRKVRSQLVMLR